MQSVRAGNRVRVSERNKEVGGFTGVVASVDGYGTADIVFANYNDGHDGDAGDGSTNHRYFFLDVNEQDSVHELTLVYGKPTPTVATDLRLKPQAKTVLRHLRAKGHISPMEALVVYSISRLAACIHDLRKAGYDVSTVIKQDAQGHGYAQYALVVH